MGAYIFMIVFFTLFIVLGSALELAEWHYSKEKAKPRG
jgi:hypothetical protein